MENITTVSTTYLGFKLGKEVFAISVDNVIEVILNQGVTSVPKTSEYIVGVINFRGDILSVVSARKKLNVKSGNEELEKVIIIVEFESKNAHSKLGIIADKVIGVLTIKENDIQPILEFGNYYNPEFLKGAFKYKGEIITILDVQKIFSNEEITIINKEMEKIEKQK
ncbi:MAG: purine-binding chemotaxis protein CheW [Bacteroidales bacterium]|nr:purine-binding chemotaxis protein CheW [Bacteroidales bacterium]